MHQLYKNIRQLRLEKHMSQDELAKLTGYTDRSSIAKIERGVVDLQQSKIELFAKALGVSAVRLVGWGDDEEIDIYDGKNTSNKQAERILKYYESLTDENKNVLEGLARILSTDPSAFKDE